MKISLTFLLLLVGSTWTASVPTKTSDETLQNADVLYPFGESEGDVMTPKEDDGHSPAIHLTKPINIFGTAYKEMFVNNNGVISPGKEFPEYTPESIPFDGSCFLAVLWTDVDVTNGGNVTYREIMDPKLLSTMSEDINQYFPEEKFNGDRGFCATWDHVSYFGSRSNRTNTVQGVLIASPEKTYMILNYGNLAWTSGVASGADPRTGLNGTAAQVGVNSGNNKAYFSMPGSRTDKILNIINTTNVNVPGRWVLQVNQLNVKGISEEGWKKLKEEEEARQAEDLAREAKEAADREAEEAAAKEAEEIAAREAEEAAREAQIPKEAESELPKEPDLVPDTEPETPKEAEPEPPKEPELVPDTQPETPKEPESEAQKTPDTLENVPPETEEEEEEDCEE